MLFLFALEKALSSVMFYVGTGALFLAQTENCMVRIKSKVSNGIEHIRIQIQRTVAMHKYCCICYIVYIRILRK